MCFDRGRGGRTDGTGWDMTKNGRAFANDSLHLVLSEGGRNEAWIESTFGSLLPRGFCATNTTQLLAFVAL